MHIQREREERDPDVLRVGFVAYCQRLGGLLQSILVKDAARNVVGLDGAIERCIQLVRSVTASNGRIFFVGNGGSAAIASHMAIDFSNWGFRALAFNDPAALTCLSNDLGYTEVFARQLATHACNGDLLFAISSSGRSPNILRAVAEARRLSCHIITLSGFTAENVLSTGGDLNFIVPVGFYGYVELSHLCVCHAILDLACGEWTGADASRKEGSSRWFD